MLLTNMTTTILRSSASSSSLVGRVKHSLSSNHPLAGNRFGFQGHALRITTAFGGVSSAVLD